MVFLGGEKNTKNEEKSLKTGNQYHVTGTIGSNLTYLATPGQVSMGVELFIGNQVMPQKFVPRFFFYSSYVLMHGFHGNPYCYSPEWGCTYKINHNSAAFQSRLLTLVPN